MAWTVRRRWLPRYEGRGLRERVRQRRARSAARRGDDDVRWYDVFDLPMVDDSLTAFVVSLLAIGAVVLLIVFGVPAVLALVDLLLVLVVAVGGIVGRFLFRRPWTVEARSASGEVHERRVVGWGRAGDLVTSIAQDIQHGRAIGTAPPGGH